MADDEQHFRLLDLPPELRVRIYECFFELPTSLEAINIFEAQQHAPNLAIAATSRLIRHEALDLGMAAVRRFYKQQSVFLQLGVLKAGQWTPEVRAIQASASALPSLPISELELRYTSSRSAGDRNLCKMRVAVTITAGGEVVDKFQRHMSAADGWHGDSSSRLQQWARGEKFTLTRDAGAEHLDVGNVLRAMLRDFREE
ncbi:hypothetical protein LTR17_007160 [Elasticomyces elasticus]|nr:hypothetical protein LTR17_007160 [Elasticomyces elasticus]